MKVYLKYLWSQIRHKWFVYLESVKLGIPFLGIIHDWSKFLPSEFVSYARFFYGDGNKLDFEYAWNYHQKRNKHHWQYWLRINDNSEPKKLYLQMPLRYAKEMLADWRGAGMAYGTPDTRGWYIEHRDNIEMHIQTRCWIEDQLGILNLDS